MPELPEAEANRRRIADGALNRTIEGFSLGDIEHVEVPGPTERGRLAGTQFTETHRHGKYIFAGSRSGPWMAVHLGMTGSLRVYDRDEGTPDYARITVEFEGDRRLTFRDPRKFGWVRIVEDPRDFVEETGLGPDAMEIGDNAFVDRVGGTRGAVKSALLDQKKLAGVGNLWSDEALYRTGILPDAVAADLSSDRIADLYRATRDVLQAVLDVNARYADLPDDWLIHHRDEGADCPKCGGTIARKTVGGRSAYHCPDHQTGA